MALAGVDQQRAELRPNTFKNLLRWWWRAGRGQRDRAREARLFGDVESEKAGARASPFRLRVCPPANLGACTRLFDKDDYSGQNGLQYLGFSLDPFGHGADPRSVIDPGTQFGVKLLFPEWFGEDCQREIWASLWLLVWFGGLGARSRRGFGGVRVVETDKTGELDLISDAGGKPELLRDFLEENLHVVRDWLDAPDADQDVPLPEYTAIAPWWTEIFVHREPERRWATALDKSGQHLMDFRNRLDVNDRSSAYHQVKDFLEVGLTPETVDRGAFGLPLIFRYNSVRAGNNTATVTGENHNRRASPLLIGTCPLSDGWFARTYVVMRARLLEEKEQLSVNSSDEHVHTSAPDFSVLDHFLDDLFHSESQYHSQDLLEVSL